MFVCVERSRFLPRAFSVTAQQEMSKGLKNKQLQKIKLLLCVKSVQPLGTGAYGSSFVEFSVFL